MSASGLADLQTLFGDAEDFPSQLQAAAGAEAFDYDWEQIDFKLLDGSSSTDKATRQARLRELRLKLQAEMLSPRRILLRDKLAFMVGSCQVWAIAYWLGWSPSSFYRAYTAQAIVLGLARYVYYRSKKWHYYLLDACYFCNLLLLLHLWLLPRSEVLSKITFAFDTGPLTWSTIAFRNSLVYHDLDKVTSVFLHLAPALVSWTLRWHPDGRFGPPPGAPAAAHESWASASLLQLVALPLLPYAAWAVLYFCTIFIWSAERIKRRGYTTLFTYIVGATKGVYASITRRVPPAYRPQVYLLLHCCFCATTFMFSWLCWHSFAVHTALLTVMGAISVWHGGNWYFSVFAKRYLAELAARDGGGGSSTTGSSRAPAAAAAPEARKAS